MKQKKIDALVLSSVPYKEAGKKLVLLSPEGKIFATIAGVTKPKAKLAFAAQPFCLGEFLFVENNGFFTVTNCTAIDSFFSVLKDFQRFWIGSMILETLSIVSQPEQESEELFILAVQALKMLAYSDAKPDIVFCRFVLDVLKLTGYFIEFAKCTNCEKEIETSAFFSFEKGGIVCRDCFDTEAVSVSSGMVLFLKVLSGTPIDKIATIIASEAVVIQSKNLLISCFEKQIGEQIKSKNLV